MSAPYRELSERIRGEVPNLDWLVHRAQRAWEQLRRMPEEMAYLDSVALNLHGFYSGLERLFELIARHIDGIIPTGETWHRDLVWQMTRSVEAVRPAVISQENARILDEFRRFRHLVRNVYTMNLSPEKVGRLVVLLPEHWPVVRAELLAFADFLEALGEAREGT